MQPGYSFLQLQALVSAAYPNRRTAIEPFSHPLTFSGLAANTQYTQTYKVLSNCDFWLTNLSYVMDDDAGALVFGTGVFLQIEDTGVQERIFYQRVPLITVAESPVSIGGQFASRGGFALEAPRRIAGNSTLQFTLNNGPETGNLELVLHGVNVYAYS